MIIVFILGYVLIGILIQLVGRLIYKEEALKMGYQAVDDIMFKNVDDKDEIAADIITGMSEEDEKKFNEIMYNPKYLAINILGWPINIGFLIVYLIKATKVLK